MARIGFIGLGNMGGPMARNLLKAGHEVRGFDLSPAALEAFAAAGGTVVSGGVAAAEGRAEDPYATLAWLANLMAERGLGLTAGMVVITGSIVPTFSIAAGDRAVFAVEGFGEVCLDIV